MPTTNDWKQKKEKRHVMQQTNYTSAICL